MDEVLPDWNADQMNAIRGAYALAVKELKENGRASPKMRNRIAEEIITMAKQGCFDPVSLATRSVLRTL